jgi:hypothetical protein
MARNEFLKELLRLILLSFLLFIYYSVVSMAIGFSSHENAMIILPIVCFFQTAVMSYPIIRSKWSGLKLILAIFLIFFGVVTFLTQIETIVFLRYLVDIVPEEEIPKFFIQGFVIAVLFSISAVVIYGKLKGEVIETKKDDWPRYLPLNLKFLARMFVIAIIYMIIYILFGMFVAMPLGGEVFQEYYAGLQLPPWILPFQIVRGLIWASLAFIVLTMMDGSWWEKALAVALIFSILPASLLLLPNPYMPDQIRVAHFFEILSSNFLFGLIATWLLKSGTDVTDKSVN